MGEGAGRGNGRGREEAPTPRAPPRAGPPPARDPWPPPYAGACVGRVRRRAPRRGRPPRSAPGGGGCAGTDASRFLVSAAGRRSPRRETAHAPPVGGFLAVWACARPPWFALARRSGSSHEFSVTDGAEKSLVIVTGQALKRPRLEPAWAGRNGDS